MQLDYSWKRSGWIALWTVEVLAKIYTSNNLSSLANIDISNKYAVTVRNKFHTLQETSERHTLNDEYKIFFTAHIKVAVKCIQTKPRAKCRFAWESLVIKKMR